MCSILLKPIFQSNSVTCCKIYHSSRECRRSGHCTYLVCLDQDSSWVEDSERHSSHLVCPSRDVARLAPRVLTRVLPDTWYTWLGITELTWSCQNISLRSLKIRFTKEFYLKNSIEVRAMMSFKFSKIFWFFSIVTISVISKEKLKPFIKLFAFSTDYWMLMLTDLGPISNCQLQCSM